MAAALDHEAFREAMAELPAGVAVITAADHGGQPVGATVSSLTSLSMEPPLVLVCLARDSDTCQALRPDHPFSLHLLQAGQEQVARAFAGKGPDKFAAATHSHGPTGAPRLAGCAVTLDCRVDGLVPGGDHLIVIGHVHHADVHGGTPLLYHRRVIAPTPRLEPAHAR